MSNKELHVLMISTDRNIFREGSNVRARMLEYAALVKTLHVIVFTRRKDGFQETQISPNCTVFPTNSGSRWAYVFDAYFLAKRLFFPSMEVAIPEISLVTTQDPFETGVAGFCIAKMLHRPLHLQVHTDLFSPAFRRGSFLNALRLRIAKFLLRSRADIRVVSGRIKTSIFNEMKFAVNRFPRVTVLPVFVDAEKFIHTPPSFDLHERYRGFELLVLVVARLEKEKNVLGAIRLVEDVSKNNPNMSIGLVVVGDGSQETMLKNYVKRANIEDRVFFQGRQNDMVSYYKSADVLLVTSLYEGYPLMFIEAAASGCLILTHDIGSASDIPYLRNAIICPENDTVCLHRNIENLASDRNVREALISAARAGVHRMDFQTKEEYLSEYKRMWEQASENDAFAPLL